MLMKNFFFVIVLCISCSCFAQTKEQVLSLLNSKIKETDNNIKIVNKVSYELKESEITTTGDGLLYNFKFGGKGLSAFSYEFDPSDIKSVEDLYMDKESPIGVLRLKFNESVVRYKTGSKRPDETTTFVNYVNIQYLKIDDKNYNELKKAFLKLKDIYEGSAADAVRNFVRKCATAVEFWFGGDGASRTYKLRNIYFTGCNLKIFYDYKEISSGKAAGAFVTYLTIVPLKDVDGISLEKTKSKPNCIVMQHGGKGFETFTYKGDDVFVTDKPVKQIPSFINVTNQEDLIVTEKYIKDAVKQCNGGRVKL